jgi:hypothetical protein
MRWSDPAADRDQMRGDGIATQWQSYSSPMLQGARDYEPAAARQFPGNSE